MKVKIPLESSKDVKDFNESAKDGHSTSLKKERIEIESQINHQGEVNRARSMPQAYNVIATKTTSGEVHIFDYFKHSRKPENDEVKPSLRLRGHTAEGYGLSWNSLRQGQLVSGSDDKQICLWDVQEPNQLNDAIDPVTIFKGHTGEVEDVCFSYHHIEQFASVSDDKTLKIWDVRQNEPTVSIDAHTQEIFCLDYSPFDENLLLTGSVDKTIAVWDGRNMSSKLFNLKGHTDDITSVKWSKMQANILASASQDRRIFVWDIARIGSTQTAEEAKDGPPEILFSHAGHTSKISDMSWNMNEQLMMASVAEDNIV